MEVGRMRISYAPGTKGIRQPSEIPRLEAGFWCFSLPKVGHASACQPSEARSSRPGLQYPHHVSPATFPACARVPVRRGGPYYRVVCAKPAAPQPWRLRRLALHRRPEAFQLRKFLVYGLFPQEGDGEVVIRNLMTGKEQREPAGLRPAPTPPTPGEEGPAPEVHGATLTFSADSKTVVFSTFPPKA